MNNKRKSTEELLQAVVDHAKASHPTVKYRSKPTKYVPKEAPWLWTILFLLCCNFLFGIFMLIACSEMEHARTKEEYERQRMYYNVWLVVGIIVTLLIGGVYAAMKNQSQVIIYRVN